MLENIRKKWKKQAEEVEKRDIEFIKKHPRRWIGIMLFDVFLLAGFSIYVVFQGGIILLVIMIPLICYIEKLMWNPYRKAFPKLN